MRAVIWAWAVVAVLGATAIANEPSLFLIGNSLTWDTLPSKLDGDVQWHVDCGKSLPYIVAHPEEPCVKTSTLWPAALSSKQYAMLVIQVHYGSTLQQDVDAIATLIKQQPHATVVIHTGWARSADRAEEWSGVGSSATTNMSHNADYFDTLLDMLRESYPQRTFLRTRAMDLLQVVHEDIRAGHSPITKVESLYRDAIHMDLVTGRYLMHNAMRAALSQPRSAAGFERLDPKMKSYLDSVLDRCLDKKVDPAGAGEGGLSR
jgi:hypothetical protein